MHKNCFIPFGMKVLCVLSFFMPVIQKFHVRFFKI